LLKIDAQDNDFSSIEVILVAFELILVAFSHRQGTPLIAINPKFDKLIVSLRTAISSDDGKLDKEQTSYHNVLDAFRLALKGIKIVKKETEVG
jgi:hypothetical protein